MPVNLQIEKPPILGNETAGLRQGSKWLVKLKLWMDLVQSLLNTLPTDHGKLTGLEDNDHPQYLLYTSTIPTSSTAAGTVRTYTFDSDYFYLCIATSQWKRARWGNALLQEPDTW
jgi:hypothetical protein